MGRNSAWVMLMAYTVARSGDAIRPERADVAAQAALTETENSQKEATGSQVDSACYWPAVMEGTSCVTPPTPKDLVGRWVDETGGGWMAGGSIIAIEVNGWRPLDVKVHGFNGETVYPLSVNKVGPPELHERKVDGSLKHVGFVSRDGDQLQLWNGKAIMLSKAQCKDLDGWTDLDGHDCAKYGDDGWCADGKLAWGHHTGWGTLADWAKPGGQDAGSACCVCGRQAGDPEPAKSSLEAGFEYPIAVGAKCKSGYELFDIWAKEAEPALRFIDECGRRCLADADCTDLAFIPMSRCMGCKHKLQRVKYHHRFGVSTWRVFGVSGAKRRKHVGVASLEGPELPSDSGSVRQFLVVSTAAILANFVFG